MSATDPHDIPHDTPPGLLDGLGPTVLRAIEPFDSQPMLGLPDAAKPAVIAALAARHDGPVLVLTPTPTNAADLVDALPLWLGEQDCARLLQFPARETAPYERQRPAPDIVEARLSVIESLRNRSPIVVADVDAAAQRTVAAVSAPMELCQGSAIRMADLIRSLDEHGYERRRLVVEPSSFAVRGGIIDFWPPAEDEPVRVELFGDDIDSIRRFDPLTQRSTQTVERVALRPAREWSPGPAAVPLIEALLTAVDRDRSEENDIGEATADAAILTLDLEHLRNGGPTARPDFWTQFLAPGTIFSHLGDESLVILDEPHDIFSRSEERDQRAEHARGELEWDGRIPRGLPHPWLSCDELEAQIQQPARHIRSLSRLASGDQRLPFRPTPRLAGKLSQLFESLRESSGRGAHILVSLQEARLTELMADLGLPLSKLAPETSPDDSAISVGRAAIAEGWQLDDPQTGERLITLISDTEIFGFERQRQRRLIKPRAVPASEPHLLESLKQGDYVVHVDSGIGRFQGVVRERIGGREGEYLDLRFARGDRLCWSRPTSLTGCSRMSAPPMRRRH